MTACRAARIFPNAPRHVTRIRQTSFAGDRTVERKIAEGDFESLRAVLNQNADVFSKHKADIGCCNFVEH